MNPIIDVRYNSVCTHLHQQHCLLEVGDTSCRQRRFDMILSISVVYQYNTIPHDTAPLPKQTKKFNISLPNAKHKYVFV